MTPNGAGMSIEKVRFALPGVAVLAAAASIAVAGIVGFVGPALMVGADVGARLALNPVQIPVGIITGLVGGPYFLYLMRKKQNMGEI